MPEWSPHLATQYVVDHEGHSDFDLPLEEAENEEHPNTLDLRYLHYSLSDNRFYEEDFTMPEWLSSYINSSTAADESKRLLNTLFSRLSGLNSDELSFRANEIAD